jgi:N-acetylglucosamine kinase-like BadF-type ATPase
VLVIGGTGSIAVAKDVRGRGQRAGGWGQLLGDEGSGFWIGRRALRDPALRRILRLDPLALARSPSPVRAVAALAPRVLRLAADNARARLVRDEAAAHLAALAAEAGEGLRWKEGMPVAYWGGVFRDRALLAAFGRALRRANGKARLFTPRLAAEDAAASLAKIDRIRTRG